jgi:hypothetical protein
MASIPAVKESLGKGALKGVLSPIFERRISRQRLHL